MASVTTFEGTTDIIDIIYELDDREIHNDIRSEIRVSEDEEVIDQEREYAYHTVYKEVYPGPDVGEEEITYIYANDEHTPVTWKTVSVIAALARDYDMSEAECEDSGYDWNSYGNWCKVPYNNISVTWQIKASSYCAVKITNTGSLRSWNIRIAVKYKYIDIPESSHIETVWSTLTVRATDPTSILKYGRRVLNLTWPLGATQEQTQSIAESYRDKYSEPVSRVTMLVKGKTDALKVQILTRKISDLITVISAQLGLNADYYINRIDYKDFTDRLPTVVWTLEEQRASELAGIFLIDTSELDGPAWIG